MTIKIQHGSPNNDYFIIAQPRREYQEPRIGASPVVEMTDPKNKKLVTKAVFISMWPVSMDDFEKMNGFSMLAYGISAVELKKAMFHKYPELKENSTIEYWLLKRL